jgi:hypothetical protein
LAYTATVLLELANGEYAWPGSVILTPKSFNTIDLMT